MKGTLKKPHTRKRVHYARLQKWIWFLHWKRAVTQRSRVLLTPREDRHQNARQRQEDVGREERQACVRQTQPPLVQGLAAGKEIQSQADEAQATHDKAQDKPDTFEAFIPQKSIA